MQDGEVDRFADSLVGYRRVGSYAVIRPPVQERFFEISFCHGWGGFIVSIAFRSA